MNDEFDTEAAWLACVDLETVNQIITRYEVY